MDVNDIKHLAVERIYLVPDAIDGELGYVWCDDPAPGKGMDSSEAVEYVRKDVHEATLEREAALAAHVAKTTLLMNRFFLCDDYSANGEGEGTADGVLVPIELVEQFAELSSITPATSLASRDLIKKAEALEEVIGYMIKPIDRLFLKSRSEKLRRQAEGSA